MIYNARKSVSRRVDIYTEYIPVVREKQPGFTARSLCMRTASTGWNERVKSGALLQK